MASRQGRARPWEGEALSEPRSTPAQQELRPPRNAYERPNRKGEALSEPRWPPPARTEPRPPKIVRVRKGV
jgi:hypothetical protein